MKTENADKFYNALIVEDDKANKIILASSLRILGFECSFAENGIEALDITKENHFDLILMDCMMPKMDGLEASKEIRKNPNHTEVPIIITTAKIGLERTKLKEIGINEIIEKPILLEKLYPIIQEYFPSLTREEKPKILEKNDEEFTENYFISFCEKNHFDTYKLAKYFLKDSAKYMSKTEKFLRKNQLNSAIKPVHALAGSASSLSAGKLSQRGRTLEKLLKEERAMDLILPIWEHVKEEHEKVTISLLNLLKKDK